MRIRLRPFFLAWAVVLTGCSAVAGQTPVAVKPRVTSVTAPHAVTPGMAQFSLRDCTAVGGKLRKLGRAQTVTCVIPYLDAGKSCRDTAECMGDCVVPPTPAGTRVKGSCSQDSGATFGCYSEVRQGKAMPAICAD